MILSTSVSSRSAADLAALTWPLPRTGGAGFEPRDGGVTTGGGVPPRPRGCRGGRGGGAVSEKTTNFIRTRTMLK